MTVEEMQEILDGLDGQNIDLSDSPTGPRDLAMFNLLNRLVPSTQNIVGAAEHDTIYLAVDVEKLLEVATVADIKLLAANGVMYEESTDSLFMFA